MPHIKAQWPTTMVTMREVSCRIPCRDYEDACHIRRIIGSHASIGMSHGSPPFYIVTVTSDPATYQKEC